MGLHSISSRELTEWMALMNVEADESKHLRDVAESGDGVVIEHGKHADEPEESSDDDGATE